MPRLQHAERLASSALCSLLCLFLYWKMDRYRGSVYYNSPRGYSVHCHGKEQKGKQVKTACGRANTEVGSRVQRKKVSVSLVVKLIKESYRNASFGNMGDQPLFNHTAAQPTLGPTNHLGTPDEIKPKIVLSLSAKSRYAIHERKVSNGTPSIALATLVVRYTIQSA